MLRWSAGLALVATVLALGACDSRPASPTPTSPSAAPASAPDPGPTASLPADPRAAVLAAAAKLGDQPFHLTFRSATSTAEGAIDTRRNISEIATGLHDGTTITVRQFGAEQYAKVDGPSAGQLSAVAGKWMRLDSSKLPTTGQLGPGRNQAAASAALLRTATGVHLVGTRTYQGRVDLSKGAGALPAALGSKMRSVPFSAVLDPWGRFDSLSYDLDSAVSGAGQLESGYDEYGVPIDIPRPAAADTVPMPAAFQHAIGL